MEAQRKFPDRWGRRQKVDAELEHRGQVSGNDTVVVQQIIDDPNSRELARQLFRRTTQGDLEEDARNSLSFFLEYTSHGHWKPTRAGLKVCEVMEKVARREIRDPGHHQHASPGRKVRCGHKGVSAWYVGNYPDHEVIISSYGASLAEISTWWPGIDSGSLRGSCGSWNSTPHPTA